MTRSRECPRMPATSRNRTKAGRTRDRSVDGHGATGGRRAAPSVSQQTAPGSLVGAGASAIITGKFLHVLLIAVPILLQVYFNSSLAYGSMEWWDVPHSVAAPGALIGASNFFELAVATAIAVFGPESGAALATVVGVLVEVPVMLSVCGICNRTRHWFVSE